MDDLEGRKDNPKKETLGEPKGTSVKEPETFTMEQVKEREGKIRSDFASDLGRIETYKTAAENARKSAEAAEERLNQRIKDQEEAELEAAQDNTSELTRIRAKQTQRVKDAELDKRERELNEKEEELKGVREKEVESTKERNAREVATKHDVDVETLIKFTDGSLLAMEDLAQALPKKGAPLIVDSSKTIGGTTGPDSAKGKMREGWDELHK